MRVALEKKVTAFDYAALGRDVKKRAAATQNGDSPTVREGSLKPVFLPMPEHTHSCYML